MKISKLSEYWNRLQAALFDPEVDSEALEASLHQAREKLPIPVIWLLGKTQAGKTSIIRAMTGHKNAEIGNGFQPCTRTAQLYDFPQEMPIVRFLDTRGLGEVDYDPEEDLRFCESQSHLLLAVMKVADLRQEALFDVLHTIRKRHPDWPLLMAHTGLHELYPPGFRHIEPYPYEQQPLPPAIPTDLIRALEAQRAQADKLPGQAPIHHIAIDFTLPEDELPPADYGLEALWNRIEQISEIGLKRQLCGEAGVRGLYARKAHQHIVAYTMTAAAAGMVPVADLVAVSVVQAKMLHALGALYGQKWSKRMLAEFTALLGTGVAAGFTGRMLAKSVVKLIPGWGQTAGLLWGGIVSGASTYALGKAAAYFVSARHAGENIEPAMIRRVYAESFANGKTLLRQRFKSGEKT